MFKVRGFAAVFVIGCIHAVQFSAAERALRGHAIETNDLESFARPCWRTTALNRRQDGVKGQETHVRERTRSNQRDWTVCFPSGTQDTHFASEQWWSGQDGRAARPPALRLLNHEPERERKDGGRQDLVTGQRAMPQRLRGGGVIWREFFSSASTAENASIYVCFGCGTHIATTDHVISRSFQGRSGPAFLFETIINYQLGPEEDRVLVTGLHTVADIHCRCCMSLLGWRYGEAFDPGQRYKQGKFILEKAKILQGASAEGAEAGGEGEDDAAETQVAQWARDWAEEGSPPQPTPPPAREAASGEGADAVGGEEEEGGGEAGAEGGRAGLSGGVLEGLVA